MQSSPKAAFQSPGLLPPIVLDENHNKSGRRSPVQWRSTNTMTNALWSKKGSDIKQSDIRDLSTAKWDIQMLPRQNQDVKSSCSNNSQVYTNNITEVFEFFDSHKDLVKIYVTERLSSQEFDKWFAGRRLVNLSKTLQDLGSEDEFIWELVKYMSFSVGMDAYRLYKVHSHKENNYVQYFYPNNKRNQPSDSNKWRLLRAESDHIDLIKDVAKRGRSLKLSRKGDAFRFPKVPLSLLKTFNIKRGRSVNHVLYQPALTLADKTTYVVEMWRIHHDFAEADKDICKNFSIWSSLLLNYYNLYKEKCREGNMTEFLLDVVKAVFEDMESLDELIKRILVFAQRLVNADRASLFLVDYRNAELVSTVFDLKFETGLTGDIEKKEIRMPINRGIAGHVALSGESMNIPDAYADYRFNRSIDEATGYKTVNILCMPIKVQGKVIGVVQMVNNRRRNNFSHDDEVAFETFSPFFGLALHHARLYDTIVRKEQKYKVALEVLSYHNTCRENEVHAVLSDKEEIAINLNDFYLDPYQYDEFKKCKAVIAMFSDLFDQSMSKFDITTVTRFMLTVKKNYRTVPYHNFDHGWSVANSMYVILKNDNNNRFDYKMRLSLFVACICHDLDHRGYTNKYMCETASPLAAMYTTSTLEHHHFNITVTILQQDGHNLFSHLSSKEYKEILSIIKHCILATDLAAFFPNLEKIKGLLSEEKRTFNWSIRNHAELAMAISMTAADLSASAKPWHVQIKTVEVIFEEFYDQGDQEREAGKSPISMMDRNRSEQQPTCQVQFLSQICLPCYEMLFIILPETKPMYLMALRNLNRWKHREKEISCDNYQFSDSDYDIQKLNSDIDDKLVIKVKDQETNSMTSSNLEVAVKIEESVSLETNTELWEDDEEETNLHNSKTWKVIDGTWIEEEYECDILNTRFVVTK